MTDNATGDRAGSGGAGTQRGSDEPIAFTPLTVPDRERGRRRNRVIGIVAAVVVIAAGITTWVVVAGGGDDEPVKHTAVIPKAFGEYTQATKPEESHWKSIGGEQLDQSKQEVRLTYLAPGGKDIGVSIDLDPAYFATHDGIDYNRGSDSMTEMLLGVENMKGVHDYPAGTSGGTIQCVDQTFRTITYTTCAWQGKDATVTFKPAVNGKITVDHDTAANLKAFLAALKIEPKKS
ncbi:hypothetical protein [Streptomyces sp. NPDC020983]|uniref:hypothetical protein n=1 Tax=Streptomyces sp. NPDC020983 TaxID=3365106 RepID=UPI0037B9B865